MVICLVFIMKLGGQQDKLERTLSWGQTNRLPLPTLLLGVDFGKFQTFGALVCTVKE